MPDSSPHHADRVARVLAAVEYVETHIHDSISVRQMADAACYSLFHFCRVFSEMTWLSPYDYAMRRRLSAAAEELVGIGGARSHRRTITDIALDYGFDSPDGFTRAFRRMFDISPSTARATRSVDLRRLPARLDADALDAIARVRILDPAERSDSAPLFARSISGLDFRRAIDLGVSDRRPTEGWLGIAYTGRADEHPQVFVATEQIDDTYPFRVDRTTGRYLRLEIADPQSLARIVELVWSTLWLRSGIIAPPDRVLVDCRKEPFTMLIPAR